MFREPIRGLLKRQDDRIRVYAGARAEYQRTYARLKRREWRMVVKVIKALTPCHDCGRQYPHYMKDFDHKPEFVKTSGVMGSQSASQAFAEMAKCDIVCANCHKRRTYLRRTALPTGPETAKPLCFVQQFEDY